MGKSRKTGGGKTPEAAQMPKIGPNGRVPEGSGRLMSRKSNYTKQISPLAGFSRGPHKGEMVEL